MICVVHMSQRGKFNVFNRSIRLQIKGGGKLFLESSSVLG